LNETYQRWRRQSSNSHANVAKTLSLQSRRRPPTKLGGCVNGVFSAGSVLLTVKALTVLTNRGSEISWVSMRDTKYQVGHLCSTLCGHKLLISAAAKPTSLRKVFVRLLTW
jgi:hypothetical protein